MDETRIALLRASSRFFSPSARRKTEWRDRRFSFVTGCFSFATNRARAAIALCAAAAVPVAIAFSAVTFQREKVWHNSLALWTDAVGKDPFLTDAPNNLGGALCDAGKFKEAVAAYELAIKNTKGKQADRLPGWRSRSTRWAAPPEADAAFKKAAGLDARYAHPDQLVKALIWEKTSARKLQKIADRSRDGLQKPD